MFSDEEWKEVRAGWAANLTALIELLESLRNDYRPRSNKRRRIQTAIERERLQQELMLKILDILRDMDRILHRDT